MPEHVPDPVKPQHRGALMPTPRDARGQPIRPGEDGWRTPTIDDCHHPANNPGSRRDGLETYFARNFEGFHNRHRNAHHELWRVNEEYEDEPFDENAADHAAENLPWKARLKHVSWAWFTLTMATGGIANVIMAGQ